MKKIVFITGTRADYGKIKSLISAVEADEKFEAYIFVSGMHLIEKFGNTYQEIIKDGYKNIYIDFTQAHTGVMSYDLGNVICNLSGYVNQIKPDLIVVHGDRIDALAGAVVGALNNIKVVHIEGGEISGTIDESIRHAITKFSHLHMVCNEEAKNRLIQLGEEEGNIFVIGSPDIDIMLSEKLPSLNDAKARYDIDFDEYGLVMYHPVTTEFDSLQEKINNIVTALIESQKNYVVIYPNNDLGSEIILNEYKRVKENKHFRMFPSVRFEHFLTLLKNAEFMIGNSSAGVRETGIYGVPDIDIGNRQRGRYNVIDSNIQHVNEDTNEILHAIDSVSCYRKKTFYYGRGDSTQKFMDIINNDAVWNIEIQKKFIDIRSTL